jgi:hypothetical protein
MFLTIQFFLNISVSPDSCLQLQREGFGQRPDEILAGSRPMGCSQQPIQKQGETFANQQS